MVAELSMPPLPEVSEMLPARMVCTLLGMLGTLARLARMAALFALPAAPPVAPPVTEMAPVLVIVWLAEEMRVARLFTPASPPTMRMPPVPTVTIWLPPPPELMKAVLPLPPSPPRNSIALALTVCAPLELWNRPAFELGDSAGGGAG